MPTDNNAITEVTLGVYVQPGVGLAYPDLKKITYDLIKKAALLPWVPQGWGDSLSDLNRSQAEGVIKVKRPYFPNGMINPKIPSFLNTEEKLKFWDELAKKVDAAYFAYAQNQVESGRAIVAAAERNAAFWDGAYKFAVTVRDAPKTVISAAGEVTSGAVSSLLKSFALPLVVVVIGYIIYTQRDALAKAAVRKVGA